MLETLSVNQIGFAQFNHRTKEIHLGLASFLLTFEVDRFFDFVTSMEMNLSKRINEDYPLDTKNIVIPTDCHEISLLLSLREFMDIVFFLRNLQDLVTIKLIAYRSRTDRNSAMN